MRIAIVTESFLPQVNGVTVSVQRLTEHLQARGHGVLIVAPGPGPTGWRGANVVRVPSVPLPGYASHRVAWPWPALTSTVREYDPDVVHLASPTVLGAQAVTVADRLDLPCLAVYQTDLAGYAARYRAPGAAATLWRWLRWVHTRADRTLAPSTHAVQDLRRHGVPNVHLWRRGVDLEHFHPARRDSGLRARLAPDGELLVGYVGRLAAEKQVELLTACHDLPGTQLVIVGDGPARRDLERLLPRAHFLGFQDGADLAALYASLDIFVHTGPHETFCQAVQEALASGVPVVAPAAGGPLDLVAAGTNGLLYPPGSPAGLRSAVLTLLRDPAFRATLAAGARPSVATRSWSSVAEQYVAHCHQVLGTAPAAPRRVSTMVTATP
jgi:phosphatidylinositol alpha 1,6-mannosyltransferase